MKVHEAIIHIFESEGIEDVFALMSEDTMELLTTMENQWGDSIELTHSRHEQGAMAMADAYSRLRDDVGVCIVGRGPAVAQTGTSLVTARKHGSKLLVLVSEPALKKQLQCKNVPTRDVPRVDDRGRDLNPEPQPTGRGSKGSVPPGSRRRRAGGRPDSVRSD